MRNIVGKFREEKIIIKVWLFVILLFVSLLVYFQVGEENQIFNTRKSADNISIENVQKNIDENIDAPLGIVKKYRS